MNHIRLLIRNQCGSHIIRGMPNPLAFQQNYSRYDGPSESGIFFFLYRQTRPNVLNRKYVPFRHPGQQYGGGGGVTSSLVAQ